jgi:membrane-associated PAP2 superfamily phosphatase
MKGNLVINPSKNFLYYVGFEVLKAVVKDVAIFCDIAPLATPWYLARLIFDPDGNYMFL